MGLFNDPKEIERKQKLKSLEDKRLAFAQKLHDMGFAPGNMILASTETGGVCGLCRDDGYLCALIGPDFGTDGDFTVEKFSNPSVRREDYFVPSEGMGGMLGFGKKGAIGFYLILDRADGTELRVPFVANLNSFAEFPADRNPLLSTKRRRGNANVVWDMQPIDKTMIPRIEKRITEVLDI